MASMKPGGGSVPGTLAELRELLEEFETVMLTTVTPDGLVRSRPMAVQQPTDALAADLWFVTAIDSPKVEEIARDRQVGVSAYRHSDRAFLSISGYAHVTQDPELARKLFQPAWKAWFPLGPVDPSIAFVQLDVERAEYWEPEGGRLRVVYEMARARLRGEPATSTLPPTKTI